MNWSQIAVLRFLFANANSPQVLEALEAAVTGKYYAPDTSLLKRAQPGDLLCYATIRDIAENTNLKLNCARDQVKKLRNAKVIESEQIWEMYFDEDANRVHTPKGIITYPQKIMLIADSEGYSRQDDYDVSVSPGGNLYRILKPQMPPLADAVLCKPEQLTLPFPPNERTIILGHRARFVDPFFVPAGERR